MEHLGYFIYICTYMYVYTHTQLVAFEVQKTIGQNTII